MPGKGRRGKKQSRRQDARLVGEKAIVYTGPIGFPGSKDGTDIKTELISEFVDVAFTGAGTTTIFQQFPSYGVTNAYTEPYGEYREYRCLGLRVHYVPLGMNQHASFAAAFNSAMLCATSIEHTPNGTAYQGTTLAKMVDNPSFVLRRYYDEFNLEVRMNGTEEAAWGDTTIAAVSQFSVGLILDTRTNVVPGTNPVATVLVSRLMQWRNRVA